ncbi:MAG: 30S ribosomal protein S19 [Patescibacteria group bacterium]
MSRSVKKGPYCNPKLIAKVEAYKASNSSTPIKTWSRSSTILPIFVGVKVSVHNGRKFIEVLIMEDMVGHKLGEFSPTTTFKKHGGKKAGK